MGEPVRKRLFEELQTYNDRLEKLLSSSNSIAELEQKRRAASQLGSNSAMDTAFRYFWRHADRLYNTLSKAWNCSCSPTYHSTKMILQHPTSAELHFPLFFCSKTNIDQSISQSWRLRETNIKVVEDPTFQNPPSIQTTSSQPNRYILYSFACPAGN